MWLFEPQHQIDRKCDRSIYTNVTLGVSSIVPIPVTFSGQVYLDFNNDCRITAVRAYAEIDQAPSPKTPR